MDLRTRVLFFLIEQIIAITVFAVCAAVCAGVFAEAYYKANDARDLSYALAAAKSGAEAYKSFGNPEEAAAVMGGRVYGPGASAVYYDKDWRVCDGYSNASYVMRLTSIAAEGSPFMCELSVERISGEELFVIAVSASMSI